MRFVMRTLKCTVLWHTLQVTILNSPWEFEPLSGLWFDVLLVGPGARCQPPSVTQTEPWKAIRFAWHTPCESGFTWPLPEAPGAEVGWIRFHRQLFLRSFYDSCVSVHPRGLVFAPSSATAAISLYDCLKWGHHFDWGHENLPHLCL